jgi:hypothetical protein
MIKPSALTKQAQQYANKLIMIYGVARVYSIINSVPGGTKNSPVAVIEALKNHFGE